MLGVNKQQLKFFQDVPDQFPVHKRAAGMNRYISTLIDSVPLSVTVDGLLFNVVLISSLRPSGFS